MTRKRSPVAAKSLGGIFGVPLLIAVVSAIGLTSALLGDDIWDVLSWATLAVPVAVIAWMVWRPAAKEQGGKSTANNRPAGNKR